MQKDWGSWVPTSGWARSPASKMGRGGARTLSNGFVRSYSSRQRRPQRETLVDELFQALVELCLLAGMPVVFAFDALETLLGDPPDGKLCHPFFKGLADVLDSHRGIPFLLLAELRGASLLALVD